jgi:hypothetical protein
MIAESISSASSASQARADVLDGDGSELERYVIAPGPHQTPSPRAIWQDERAAPGSES